MASFMEVLKEKFAQFMGKETGILGLQHQPLSKTFRS